MQNCPAPVVSVSPGRTPLDQQVHDLGVGAGGGQVKRGLVWGAGSGVRVSILLKLLFLMLENLEPGLAPPPSRARARSVRPRDTARWSGVRECTSRSSRGKSSWRT